MPKRIVREDLMALLARPDREGAKALLEDWGAEHGYERLIYDVLDPVLKQVGEEWEREGRSLAHAYIAAKVAGDVMSMIAEKRGDLAGRISNKGPVVLGNVEDDCHSLGRHLVTTFLEVDGWQVNDLGNDVPPGDFVDRALESDARVIGVSAMMYTTATNIEQLRAEIDARAPRGRIQLAVGGAAFGLRPELVKEVGGDGTAKSAVGAAALFADLWKRSLEMDPPQ